MPLKVGEKAPDFTLVNTDREQVSLSDFRGKNVVLAFFPAAFSGVCDTEMCNFRDSLSELNNANAEVLGISADNPLVGKEFKNKHGLGFQVLSDYTLDVSRKYDSVFNGFLGLEGFNVSNRTVYVVDKEGTIRYAWQAERPPVEPDYDEVKQAVKQLG
ncbi:MAG: redoxin domain-containing protein [Chloroflexota bacterium]